MPAGARKLLRAPPARFRTIPRDYPRATRSIPHDSARHLHDSARFGTNPHDSAAVRDALNKALDEELARDEKVYLMGEARFPLATLGSPNIRAQRVSCAHGRVWAWYLACKPMA